MSGVEAAIASGLFKVAGNKLGSLIASEFAALTGVKKDLRELGDKSGMITSWLSAFRDRSIENEPRYGWVKNLKDVAYDIDDLLHEVHMEAEKHRIYGDEVCMHATTGCFCAKPKSFLFRYKVASKIKEIKVKYAAIVKQINETNAIQESLPPGGHPGGSRNVLAGELSLLDNVGESKIPIRDEKRSEIISKLLNPNETEQDWIVSIVGLGGAGKTTVAKHICHDSKIKEHFKGQIFWVHVSSEAFDKEKLIGKLFEGITMDKSDNHTLQGMVNKISDVLRGHKFLLVLDDAWHENSEDWEYILCQVNIGGPGSKVLLTTRNLKVAEAVKSRLIFNLALLSDAESWGFFLKSSGWVEEDLTDEFIQVGKEILNRCGGLPLAIKTIGGTLCQRREISTWRSIRESNLWDQKDRVLPSLKLSFIHLADELKQCVTFCSIFPKGYEIKKDLLIAQWIAHGCINPMNKENLEDIGSGYFDSLVKVGFLQEDQDSYETWWADQTLCKMHDLIHDLTRQILQDEVVTSIPSKTTTDNEHRCRYLSLTSCTEKVDRDLLQKAHGLFVFGGNPSLDKTKKNHSVRSVILNNTTTETQFPVFILKFEFLGYLEIRNFSCRDIPEAISGCWNLQSLHLRNCKGLMTLPESIGKLKKLRNLVLIWAADLQRLPQSIGDCQDLQSLQLCCCHKLTEIPSSIGKAGNLRVMEIIECESLEPLPSQSISQFNNLKTITLAGCQRLKCLPSTLTCGMLHTLNLSRTKITTLPQWVTSIGTLVCIDLGACTDLVELPRGIENLKRLEVLNTEGCTALRAMPSGIGQLTLLRTLGWFTVGCRSDDAGISELENLNMLSGFLVIDKLKLSKDPSAAEKACLKHKKNIDQLTLIWSARGMKEELAPDEGLLNAGGTEELVSETEHNVLNAPGIEEELISNLNCDQGVLNALEPPQQIKELTIRGCGCLHLPCWMRRQTENNDPERMMLNPQRFSDLIRLRLAHLPNLKHIRGIVQLASLKSLFLQSMPNLEDLWITTSGCGSEAGEEEVASPCCFPVLSKLDIEDCPKLVVKPSFPQSLESLTLTGNHQFLSQGSAFCLQRLKIYNCSAFALLPECLGELHSLRELAICWCPMLARLPESIQHLTSLQELELWSCDALTTLPDGIGELHALRSLKIWNCSALKSLPPSIKSLTGLELLGISGCPDLARLYEEREGTDWHLISHIPRVYVS